jgi:hypothetical protein
MQSPSNPIHIDQVGQILDDLNQAHRDGKILNIVVSYLGSDGIVWSTWPRTKSFMEQVALVNMLEHSLYTISTEEGEVNEPNDVKEEDVPSPKCTVTVLPSAGTSTISSTSYGIRDGNANATKTGNSYPSNEEDPFGYPA